MISINYINKILLVYILYITVISCQKPKIAIVTGIVMSDDSNSVHNANVLFEKNGSIMPIYSDSLIYKKLESSEYMPQVLSDSNGRFKTALISNNPIIPASYYVLATKEGYDTARVKVKWNRHTEVKLILNER